VERLSASDARFAAALRKRIRGQVREAEPLARYSTYRIGGPATVVHPAAAEDVATALRMAAEAGVPWFVLGLGSNILLPDEGLEALVIRLGKGLDRLHIFVGVPGTAGGGVYMNAGCHGGEWAEVVETVTVVDGAGNDAVLPRAAVPFTYRRSGLDGRVVVEVTVRLRQEEQHRLDEQIAEMFEWRQKGTPFNQPCCGSVFKNPAGPSWKRENGPRTAGQLIEAAGLKGFAIGGAQVSPMHANYFVNTGGATADEVKRLIAHAQRSVQERFGVRLQPEVKLIGRRGEYLNSERDSEHGVS
jgi:UDP-N-acetylmuramate dehydrogenase